MIATSSSQAPGLNRPVTLKHKCYVFVCASCGLLAESYRSDALTCSIACRVKAHRDGKIQRLKKSLEGKEVKLSLVLRVNAAVKLIPELHDRIMNDGVSIESEAVRVEIWQAYWGRLLADMEQEVRP